MESKLINYSIFIEKRPDMEVHTEVAIVSCINSAYVLLDGECASLISQVDKFNMVDDRSSLDTTHELYRTDFELGQLQEALVFQVQYVLNMGNDFTVGGGSYSIGNINSSFSRPEGRELIAPGVYKLLSNARVYHLNAFGSFSNQNTNEIPLSTSKEIMERVKNEYVAQNQPNAQVGNVAYINQSKQVAFGSPQDLQITTYNTNRIAGPEGYRNNYYEIDSVPNIAFFGPDYNGTYSAVHRQEMIDYVNDNAGANLAADIAQIKQEQEEQNNKINLNKNLIDSTYEEAIGAVRKNAEQDETIRRQETRIESNWNNVNRLNHEVRTNTTNIQTNTNNIQTNTNEISAIKAKDIELENRIFQHENEIVRLDGWSRALDTTVQAVEQKVQTNTNNITALDSRLVSVSGLLDQTIDGLRTLKPFEYVGEFQQGISYKTNQLVSKDNNLYLSKEDNNTDTPPSAKWLLLDKDFASIDLNNYYTKLEVDSIKNDLQNKITTNTTSITTNTNNITKLNNEVVKLAGQQIITGKKIFTGPGEGIQIRPNATGGSSYITGYDFEGKTKKWVLGNTGKNEGMLLEAPLGDIYIKPGANGNIQCYNKLVRQVAVPTANTDAANKKYVDDAIKTAAPTDLVNRIQSLETNTVKLTGDQRIQGNKIIEHATIVYGEVSQLSTVNKELSLVNKKYVDDAINTAIGNNSGVADLANQLTTINQTLEEHELEINSYGSLIQTNIDGITRNRVNIAANGRNIESNTSKIESNTNQITYLKSHTVTNDTDQTINGTKTFAMKILANGGITNLTDPINIQDAATKYYVDTKTTNSTLYRQVFSNTSTIYSTNQTTNITISNYVNSNSAAFQSWMIIFDRMGNNGNSYEGTFNLNFMLPDINKATWVEANTYFNSSNKRFQDGSRAGITIYRVNSSQLQLTFQLWDGGNRIKNVKLLAPPA